MRRVTLLIALSLLAAAPLAAQGPQVVWLDSNAPLLQVKVMVRAGSAQDPEDMEGLAYLTGRLLIEGGFGKGKKSVTKERLAEITRPWGEGAYPDVNVSKETSTFSMLIPREHLDEYVAQVLQPMFTQPEFSPAEVDRVRAETVQLLTSTLRFEQIELTGLIGLDNLIHQNDGTGYGHPDIGTETGLKAITPEAVGRFYATHYTAGNITIGIGSGDAAIHAKLQYALNGAGQNGGEPFARKAKEAVNRISGRSLTILALPNAISTGLHAGFPIEVTRKHPDYWPLYIANIYLGTHRDGFSYLYRKIREERGYNYGDYSYIEHFEGRPFNLFPPTNSPRAHQYFSIWVRPIQDEYAHHLLKAFTWELENFIRTGLTESQCDLARNKARVLYLSLAENGDRLLGYKLDDAFDGLDQGYLDGYLDNVNAVTCDQVNAAIRNHLQSENLAYLVVTHNDQAQNLAEAVAADTAAWGKGPADYQIDSSGQDSEKVFTVTEEKLELLLRDSAWAHHWLNIPKDKIRIVPAERLFETRVLVP